MNVNWRSNRVFYLFFFASLLLSLLISMLIVGQRAESILLQTQRTASNYEASYAIENIRQYLVNRQQVLEDIARSPVVANSVMGSDIERANLDDFLNNLTILGNKENITVFNVLGEAIYGNKGDEYSDVSGAEWFQQLLNDGLNVKFTIHHIDEGFFFEISVPILYNGFVEGVLTAQFNKPLASFFAASMKPGHAIRLVSDAATYQSFEQSSDFALITNTTIAGTHINAQYFIRIANLEREKREFMSSIALAVLLSLTLSFCVLAIFGKRYILNPFKQLAEAKELNELLAQAIEAAPIGISIADAKQQGFPLTYVNQGFLNITGYRRKDVLGRNCQFLQGPETSEKSVELIRQTIQQQQTVVVELVNYRKNGEPFWNILHLSPIFDEQGELVAFIGIQQDVTERKEFEHKLEWARIEAESANRTKSDFLANMSHEIRTPMNGVIGMLNLLKRETLTPEQKQKIDIANSSATSLLSLINDVLDFSKIEAGKLALESIQFDAEKLIEDTVEGASVLVQEKGLELILDTSGMQAPLMEGDPNRIRQVLTNILGNAIKFTRQGEVVVKAECRHQDDGTCLLHCTVADSGEGIAANRIDALFDAFTQADASMTRRFGGSGLGLAIVKKLCKLMGGNVTATSELGVGSEFVFWVKLTAATNSNSASELNNGFSGSRVLLVESHNKARQAIAQMLTKMGATVVVSKSQAHLLQTLTDHDNQNGAPFDVVLLSDNFNLPATSDDVFFQTLKDFRCLHTAYCILLTTFSENDALTSYQHTPIFGYINKPVSRSDLVATQRLLKQKPNNAANASPINVRRFDDTHHTQSEDFSQKTVAQLQDKRILLVEDNDINQIVATSMLNHLGFTHIETANNGVEAIDALNADSTFDIVLMDCQMPELDGYEATQCIRRGDAGSHYRTIPIVAMTANAMRGDKEKCLAAGMNGYITKPIAEEALYTTLIEWLDG